MSEELKTSLTDSPLQISIDRLTVENSKLVFTISIKTILPQYGTKEATVKRKRSEFFDLHRLLNENPGYAGLIIPSVPPDTDFSVDRDCLSVFTEEENPNSPEYQIMKKELEREYVAKFKKVLYMHGYFLNRISSSPLLRIDHFVIEFLTFDKEINFSSDRSWMITNIFGKIKKKISDTVTYAFTEDIQENDEFFEQITEFTNLSIEALRKIISDSDEMTLYQKRIANIMIKIGYEFQNFESISPSDENTFSKIAQFYDHVRNYESAISSDEDLKISDTFRYHLKIFEAIKDTLDRRFESLYKKTKSENAYKQARNTNQNVVITHHNFEMDSKEFDDISDKAKEEMKRESKERVINLKTNFIQYCNLEIKNNKNIIEELNKIIEEI